MAEPSGRLHRIGVIPGTASGGAAVTAALDVARGLGARFDVHLHELGADRYRRTGEVLPGAVLDDLRDLDAVLRGSPPISDGADIPPGLLDRGIVFGLREGLDLTVNLRRFQGVGAQADIDITVVRESSEGGYLEEGGILRQGTGHEVVTQGSVHTRFGVERCVRFAFEQARARRGQLTLAHKTQVMRYSGGLWERVVAAVGADHPDVAVSVENVDVCCARLVEVPERYDVIVSDNVFGDIVSDVACAVARALGHSASIELQVAGTGPSLFEPMHDPSAGSHPDGAGDTAVLPAVRAVAALLRHLGDEAIGVALEAAVLRCASEAALAASGSAARVPAAAARIVELAGEALVLTEHR